MWLLSTKHNSSIPENCFFLLELRGHIIGLVLVAKTVAATLPYVFFEVESVEFKTSVTFFASQIIFHRQNISLEGSVVEK